MKVLQVLPLTRHMVGLSPPDTAFSSQTLKRLNTQTLASNHIRKVKMSSSRTELFDLLRRSNPDQPNSYDLSETQDCYICHRTLVDMRCGDHRSEEYAYQLRCGHTFGVDCLVTWLEQDIKNTCPMCREPIVLPDLLPTERGYWYSTLAEWTPGQTYGGDSRSDADTWAIEAEHVYHRFWDDLLRWLDGATSAEDWMCGRLPVVTDGLNAPNVSLFADAGLHNGHRMEHFERASPINFPLLQTYARIAGQRSGNLVTPDIETYRRMIRNEERVQQSRQELLTRIPVDE